MKRVIAFVLTAILAILAYNYTESVRDNAYRAGQNAMVQTISDCSLEDAHAEKCFIPCSTDTDCMQKNGQEDH